VSDFAQFIAEGRRLQLLRFLVELGGQANETVILSAMRRAGFASTTRDELRGDLDHLHRVGCLEEEWVGELRVVKLAERGEDVAHGRIACGGVKHERDWRRAT
jgi:hypothetical protein